MTRTSVIYLYTAVTDIVVILSKVQPSIGLVHRALAPLKSNKNICRN